MTKLLCTASLTALSLAGTPALAQSEDTAAILARLNQLEEKVSALEARNRELEAQVARPAPRAASPEAAAPATVQVKAPAPTFEDPTGNFSFKPRGTFQLDYAAYRERAGGYDYSNGTDIRRARFGFDGTAFKNFRWRLETEFVKGNVNLLDAYVQYVGKPHWVLTVGQHKAPYGLEANAFDPSNTFLERGMFVNAFGTVGAERRVGVSLAYQTDAVTATAGMFGGGETFQRANRVDETYGGNARITWEPVREARRLVHLGASGFLVTNLAGNAATIADRPGVRVDNGNLVSVALAPVTTGAAAGLTRGVKDATYAGAEAVGVWGPFSIQGEYGRLHVDRYDAVADPSFDGFYLFGSWFVTGETRVFRSGLPDRIKPVRNFGSGGPGAIELALRYDRLDLTDAGLSPLARRASTWTAGLNWYLNPNLRFILNYVRFEGLNSPLVVAPAATFGTTAKGDTLAGRLQFDF